MEAVTTAEGGPGELTSARILIVEDEHLVALDMQQALRQLGHIPVVAHSADEALRAVGEQPIDLVLMDIRLKGSLDGIEAARAIRLSSDVPVIYLTAYADDRTLERARQTEPDGYLLKPFQDRELKAAIDMTLQRRASWRRQREQQELQQFLAEASTRMSATLDHEAILREATELLVPRYADWCAIHVAERYEAIPGQLVMSNHGQPVMTAPGYLLESVRTTGRPELYSHVPDLGAFRELLGEEPIAALRTIGASSLICVPLRSRTSLLGALAVVRGSEQPHFSRSDVVFFEHFAERLAGALENALLYRALEHAMRMRDDVLTMVSHDLRIPLGNILVEAVEIAQQPEADHARLADGIAQATQRMNRLISDLIDATAINSGQLRLTLSVSPVADIVEEAAAMSRAQADDLEITLVAEPPPRDVQIQADRDRIVQALGNLISQALRSTQHGGTITISAALTEAGVWFEVRDNGPGLSDEQLPRLIESFWHMQVDNEGATLGLFIARGILAAHGTSLVIDAVPGSGTRFSFVLPRMLGHAAGAEATA